MITLMLSNRNNGNYDHTDGDDNASELRLIAIMVKLVTSATRMIIVKIMIRIRVILVMLVNTSDVTTSYIQSDPSIGKISVSMFVV